MKQQLKIVIVLTAISVIASGLITIAANYTQPLIEKNAREALQKALSDVLPGLVSFQEKKRLAQAIIFSGRDGEGKPLGYAIYCEGSGFADKIKLLVGIDLDFHRLRSIKILEQKETPGLGSKIEDEDSFLQFWRDKSLAKPFVFRKPPVSKMRLKDYEVNAISGATISSDAVTKIVNQAVAWARKEIGR
jgi:electron transport complex protein RnfG